MRPLISIAITILLFAGVYGYTSFVESVRKPPLEIQTRYSTGEYRLKVSRSFDCASSFDLPAISVRFRGQDVLKRETDLPQTEVIEIDPLPGVEQSENEIFVEANKAESGFDEDWGEESEDESAPKDSSLDVIRVQIFRDDSLLLDHAIWGTPGSATITGSVTFSDDAPTADHEHE